MTDTFNLLPMNDLSSFAAADDDESLSLLPQLLPSLSSAFAKNNNNQKKMKKQPYAYVSPSMEGYQQKMKMAQSIRNGGICYNGSSGQNVGRRMMPLKQLLLVGDGVDTTTMMIPIQKFQVPIFQRRYCWTETQWQTLLMDAATASTTNNTNIRTSADGFHSLGRLTCTNDSLSTMMRMQTTTTRPVEQEEEKVAHDDDQHDDPKASRSIILDGQQRFTTVTLLLAAIRDALWKRQQRSLMMVKNKKLMPNAALDPVKASQLIQEIDQILFPDYDDYQQWLLNSPQLEEGIELTFAKLIPTYCDRWSYYSAILPKHTNDISHRLVLSSQEAEEEEAFHRPLAAKNYYDAILSTFSNGELLKLLDGIYHKLTMLIFPIEFKGRTTDNDGTEDFMVIYERLAMRDATTWCPPPSRSLAEYYVTIMSGLDMIRNAMLGNFENETNALEFYQTYWLPMERMAATTTTTTKSDDDQEQQHQQKEEERNMESMMHAFLDQQAINTEKEEEEEEKIEEGIVGGMLYVRFQLWQDRRIINKKITTTEAAASPLTAAEQATRLQGEAMLAFAKGYFQSSS